MLVNRSSEHFPDHLVYWVFGASIFKDHLTLGEWYGQYPIALILPGHFFPGSHFKPGWPRAQINLIFKNSAQQFWLLIPQPSHVILYSSQT